MTYTIPPIDKTKTLAAMSRKRGYQILAFHRSSFWMALLTPFFVAPIAMMMTSGDISTTLGITAASLAFSAMIACTLTDLMSMRIPDAISVLPFLAAILLWIALSLGFEQSDPHSLTKSIFIPYAPVDTNPIVPYFWPTGLGWTIISSFLGAFLILIPLLGSVLLGTLGGGDMKFMPPLAVYFGWSLAFDFLFLTFLFGGFFGILQMIVRFVTKALVKQGSNNATIIRLSRMKTLAYAPAIALSAIVCFAAKWEGFL